MRNQKLDMEIGNVDGFRFIESPLLEEPEPCQSGDWDPDYKRERFGNNKYKPSRAVAKRKRQLSRKAKQRQRKLTKQRR